MVCMVDSNGMIDMKIVEQFRKELKNVLSVILSVVVAIIIMHHNRSVEHGVLSREDGNGNELIWLMVILLLIAFLMAMR